MTQVEILSCTDLGKGSDSKPPPKPQPIDPGKHSIIKIAIMKLMNARIWSLKTECFFRRTLDGWLHSLRELHNTCSTAPFPHMTVPLTAKISSRFGHEVNMLSASGARSSSLWRYPRARLLNAWTCLVPCRTGRSIRGDTTSEKSAVVRKKN